jgi:hypothetical protein
MTSDAGTFIALAKPPPSSNTLAFAGPLLVHAAMIEQETSA